MLKDWCDGESCKILKFWRQLNKAQMYSPLPQNTFDCVKHKLAVIFLFITDGKKKCCISFFYLRKRWSLNSRWERITANLAQGKVTNILPEIIALSPLHMNHFFRASKGQKQRLSLTPFSFPLLLTCLSPCLYPMWLHICSTLGSG